MNITDISKLPVGFEPFEPPSFEPSTKVGGRDFPPF